MNTIQRTDLAHRFLFSAVLLGSLVTAAAHPTAQALTSALTYPVNGATNVDLSQPIQWTTVTNANAYQLYLGSTVGASDILNSRQTQATSFQAANVPPNQTVHARIWVQVGGIWRYTDSSFTAATRTTQITYPANGAIDADDAQPIQWVPVVGAQAYQLYLGSTPGAMDVLNSRQTQATSFPWINTPVHQTLYARIWVEVGNIWRYTDSSFTGARLTSQITFPANGATNADLAQAIQWIGVPDAQAYQLYLGSTPGGRDFFDSRQTQGTSVLAINVPANQTIYARIWVKVGLWRYTDSTFSAAPQTSTMTYPSNGATNADLTQPIQWTSVLSVQAYGLWIGSTPGTNDLLTSPELHQTSWVLPKNVPPNRPLYVRMLAKVGGVWRSTDSTFSAAPLVATMIYPANGSVNVDRTRLATWTNMSNADGYHLYVGSSRGARDLLDCGETLDRSCALGNMPVGQTLYARLYTRLGGVWRFIDSTFTAAPTASEFVYPLDGATNVDVSQPFQWTTAISAEGYKLSIGTTPGDADITDSGETAGTSYLATGLPTTGILYARVWTKVNGTWARHSDIMFSAETRNDVATIVTPVNGTIHFNTLQPFQWSSVAIARGYRLRIGTTPGGSDLHDSGEIRATQRFVPGLPVGVPLFGRVEAKIDGVWTASPFTFQVTGNTVSPVNQVKGALWATNFVRQMASDDDGRPFGWSKLVQSVGPRYNALDADYATTLLQILAEVNIQTPARRLRVAFNATSSDVHTLVEVVEPSSLRWIVVDPTFDVAARRSDGTWASADDISAASLAWNWSTISYVFLGSAVDAYVRSNYLDYPLLYVNVYHEGQPFVPGVGNSPLPYLQPVSLPASGAPASYAITCTASAFADVVIDGATVRVNCDGIASSSAVFRASTVAAPDGSPYAFQLGRVTRFVF